MKKLNIIGVVGRGKLGKKLLMSILSSGEVKRGKMLGYPPQPKFPRHLGKTSKYFPGIQYTPIDEGGEHENKK